MIFNVNWTTPHPLNVKFTLTVVTVEFGVLPYSTYSLFINFRLRIGEEWAKKKDKETLGCRLLNKKKIAETDDWLFGCRVGWARETGEKHYLLNLAQFFCFPMHTSKKLWIRKYIHDRNWCHCSFPSRLLAPSSCQGGTMRQKGTIQKVRSPWGGGRGI